jgi:hypothetical protein
MLRIVVCLFAAAALTACPGGGTLLDTLDFPQVEPQAKDLVGLYLPDAATLRDIRERGHYPGRAISISLSADGTFACTNIPDWWAAAFGKPSGGFITKNGSWKPVRQQDRWVVGLDSSSRTRFTIADTSLFLVGAKPPFILRIYLGDSDEGKVMQFAKHE